jgi:hypothetical protein
VIHDRSFRGHRRIYNALLVFYPRSFRRDYGALMTQAFGDRLRDKGAARTWAFVGADLAHSVPQQIMEVSLMSQKWIGAITVLSSVALVTAFAIGTGPPSVLAGGVVALFSLYALMAAKRNSRPAEYLYGGTAPKAWTWWTMLAALLGVTYVVFAVGQFIDDPKPTNLGAVGIMCSFTALIAVGLRFRARSRIAGNWMVVFATIPALMFFWIVVPAAVGLAIIVGAVIEISRATPQAPVAT